MNKVICEICGTSYPEDAEYCPICDSPREYAEEASSMPLLEVTGQKTVTQEDMYFFEQFRKADAFEDYEEEDGEAGILVTPRPHRTSAFLVALFTAMIALFLGTGLFLLLRYYLPGIRQEPVLATQPPETTLPAPTEEEVTEVPTIPCDSLVLLSGVPELTRQGQYWLMHVIVLPEDTTDVLGFISADESVVTVTGEGRLCAVGEGKTTVVITCGDKEILCPVTVAYAEETEPPTEPTAVPQAEEETEAPEEEQMEETEETEESGEFVLKLKDTDISFTKKGVTYQLELEGGIDPADAKWLTWDPKVAIVHDGLITVVGRGTTRIVVQYDGQQTYCIVRCNF